MNRTIGDIMERDAYTCRYDQNLGEVVTLFNELGTSGLAVVDEELHVVGFISDGDIMKAVAAQKTRSIFGGGYANMVLYDNESFEEKARALKRRNVMELAVQRVLCATADQTIGEIADVLAKKKFKKVPVIDENGKHRHGHVYSCGVWRTPIANYTPHLIFDATQYQILKDEGYITEEREAVIKSADSPEALAELIGADPEKLSQTLADFDTFAQAGRDYQFNRAAESMRPFDGGPLYAAEFRPLVLNTQGGPRRNKNAEVVSTQGDPIPHLYSAGELGGITPFQYNSGGNLAECMVFGKIAGTNAAVEKDPLPAYEALKPVDPAIAYEPGAASDAKPEQAADVQLAAGEYVGVGAGGMGGDVTVKVAYADGTITAVEVVSQSETPEIGGKALETLPAQVVAANSADVDAVSGATLTSTAFMAAVKDAISQA